jgi:hypothetical protein
MRRTLNSCHRSGSEFPDGGEHGKVLYCARIDGLCVEARDPYNAQSGKNQSHRASRRADGRRLRKAMAGVTSAGGNCRHQRNIQGVTLAGKTGMAQNTENPERITPGS